MTSRAEPGCEAEAARGFAALSELLTEVDSALASSEDSTPRRSDSGRTEGPPRGTSSTCAKREAQASPEAREREHRSAADLADQGRDATPPRGATGGFSPLWLGLGGIAACALLVALLVKAVPGAKNGSPAADVSQTPVAPRQAQTPTQTPRVHAVAATNANLRAQPSTKAKIVGTLSRGTAVSEAEQRDGFVKVMLAGGAEAWISADILIDSGDLHRLQTLSPSAYMTSRQALDPVGKVTDFVRLVEPQLKALWSHVQTGSADLAAPISAIEIAPRPNFQPDTAAGRWYSLAARSAADSGDHAEAISQILASIYADPLNADHHTALGYSAIASGNQDLLQATAMILPALAPGSTNTWVILGFLAGLRDGDGESAQRAFVIAIERSRHRATTLRVLEAMAQRSGNATVVAAAKDAIAKSQAGPKAAGS